MADQRCTKTISVTPETFAVLKEEHASVFMQHSMYDYARLKAADLSTRDRTIKSHQDYITMQEGRLAKWTGPTFKREAGEWVAL